MAEELIGWILVCAGMVGYGVLALWQRSPRWRLIAAVVMTLGSALNVALIAYMLLAVGLVMFICGMPMAMVSGDNAIVGELGSDMIEQQPAFIVAGVAAVILLVLAILHYQAASRLGRKRKDRADGI
ncbi:MAG: hypothetical protein AAFV33_28690 [Chloroflexota bacterium]